MVAPAPFGQNNYESGYPNEEIHCCDYHYCFWVVGSNSYYALSILIYTLPFGLNNFAFIRLPVKNDLASWIHGKGSMYYERISYRLLTDVPIQASRRQFEQEQSEIAHQSKGHDFSRLVSSHELAR